MKETTDENSVSRRFMTGISDAKRWWFFLKFNFYIFIVINGPLKTTKKLWCVLFHYTKMSASFFFFFNFKP